MWKQLLTRLRSGVISRFGSSTARTGFYVYRVKTSAGERDIVSLFSGAFEAGLITEAIVGEYTHLLEEGESANDASFRPNPAFVRLLHDVIERHAPQLRGLQAEARRQGTGWVYVIDARTPTPDGEVPPCDVIGGFEVSDGDVIPHSYRPNPNHRLLTENGLFGLDPALHERLMERINERIVARSPHSTG